MASRSSLQKANEFGDYLTSTPTKFQHLQAGDRKYESGSEETMVSYENKLPLNLFYTSAEYNKMLITNGKSVKKRSQPVIEGFIGDLQFINEAIFLSCENWKQMLKNKYKGKPTSSERKQVNCYTEDICCCCDEACEICVKEQQQKKVKSKLSNYELETALESTNKKPVKSKSISKKVKKIITSQVQIKPKPDDFTQHKHGGVSDKECSSSYLSHKSFNIDHLICRSLVKFEQNKREEKLKAFIEKQKKVDQNNLLKKMDEDIRLNNKESLERSRSRKGSKSLNSKSHKNDLHFKYWESVRDTIAQSLLKDKASKPKSAEKISKSPVDCEHKPKMSPDVMKELAEKHLAEAELKIEAEEKEKQKKKKELQRKLKELEKNRIEHIEGCCKKKFKPTPKMIEEAFKNIVEQKESAKQDTKVKNKSKPQKNQKRL